MTSATSGGLRGGEDLDEEREKMYEGMKRPPRGVRGFSFSERGARPTTEFIAELRLI